VAPAPSTYTSTPASAPDLGPARKAPAPRRPVRDQATARPPWLGESKKATSVRTDSGEGMTRTVISVAIPSVPSEPTKTPCRS
jgi:hypothetical protein